MTVPRRRWLLLIHQLPPKPDYFRVKIWRRLQRLGAVAIKNSVYVLPESDQSFEHFQWLVREIVGADGEASVCDATFVDGLSDGQIEALFRSARSADYAAVAEEAEAMLRTIPAARGLDGGRRAEIESTLSRLHRRLEEIAAIDFFGTPARRQAEGALGRVEVKVRGSSKRPTASGSKVAPGRKSGRTWVTRKGVYVDRIASAWLIRKFIDPRARFRFVEEREYQPRPSEVRFDMFEGEYTHEGDRCTFEVLLDRFALDQQGLKTLGEMVHDIDLKDSKFGLPETAGLQRVLDGIRCRHADDEARITESARVLDAIYQSLQGEGKGPAAV